MRKTVRTITYISFFLFFLAIIAVPPLLLHTQIYPLAVVEGNSMYPNLTTGDIVIFSSASEQEIAKGTIIVYVQGGSGIPLLDSMTKPIVIHRVINIMQQSDGAIYYRTKGDNNKFEDAGLVRSNNVMGIPIATVPKIGFILTFLRSPQGLVAATAVIMLFSLSKYDAEYEKKKKEEKFLGDLAKKVITGEMEIEVFKKIELAVKYSDSLNFEDIDDSKVAALVDWVKKGMPEDLPPVYKTKSYTKQSEHKV